jgi:hypothetical protein
MLEGWIEYEGKGCPVPDGTLVNWRNLEQEDSPLFWDNISEPAQNLDWDITGESGDITHYRVVEE